MLYALLLKVRKKALAAGGDVFPEGFENAVFMDTFVWFPIAFLAGLTLMLGVHRLWLREAPRKEAAEQEE